jgi:hypothetical protein
VGAGSEADAAPEVARGKDAYPPMNEVVYVGVGSEGGMSPSGRARRAFVSGREEEEDQAGEEGLMVVCGVWLVRQHPLPSSFFDVRLHNRAKSEKREMCPGVQYQI